MRWLFTNWRIASAIAGLASLAILFGTYRAALIEQGREACQAEVEAATALHQAMADQVALDYEASRADRQVETRQRTREVIQYVEVDSDCDWSPDAFRMLNDGLGGGDAAREPGAAMPGPANYRITQPA